jgi:copper homeostasis protein
MIKEACVEGFTEALRAQELGADRIELCENLEVGGTTPSWGTLCCCKKYLKIPVIAMIRPRGGSFVYSQEEQEIMAGDIKACLSAGIDGIAIGMLTAAGEVDLTGLHNLLKSAGNMQVTFHKAIDVTRDPVKEFIRLRDSGIIKRVLTSGGAPTAREGAGMIRKMIVHGSDRLTVVAAGKVTCDNLVELSQLIPAEEFHGRKIVGDLRQKEFIFQ